MSGGRRLDVRADRAHDSTVAESELPDYVLGLLQPDAYPHRPQAVELRQTHISYVFLAGDLVYKTKKPVDFGFIDQVAPETRERFCHAEVRLNRRLASDVYLGVAPVTRTRDGRFAVEGESGGETVEWAVKMRRLPDDRTLDRLLAKGNEPPDLPERIVRRLIAFHDSAEVVANDPEFAGGPGERAWWRREYSEAEQFIGDSWRPEDAEATRVFVEQTIDEQQALFDERLAAGRVVEGHGDLQAKHVYLLEPGLDDGGEELAIVDCIEFNDWFHFRYLDVGYDVAFLAMDLEALGRPDLGDELAGRYIAAAQDETMGLLQPLHRAFRAFVRGKVESIGAHAHELPKGERRALAESAARYFRLAAAYAERRAAPCLVVMTGLSGSGKTTVGATLAGRIGAALVTSDAVRRAVAQAGGVSTNMWQQYRAGAYAPEMNRRTYEGMRERARRQLEAGRPVILDATHSRAADRAAAVEIARELRVPHLIADLRVAEDVALERLAGRELERRGVEVHEDAYRRHVETFELVKADEEPAHLVLDAAEPPSELALRIAAELPGAL